MAPPRRPKWGASPARPPRKPASGKAKATKASRINAKSVTGRGAAPGIAKLRSRSSAARLGGALRINRSRAANGGGRSDH